MLNANGVQARDPRRALLVPFLLRQGERVFCYELYHQLRVEMKRIAGDTESSLVLQAELKKHQIGDLVADHFKVRALSAEYFPDFLLHSPGDFDHQAIVMEVKTRPNLRIGDIRPDLEKLNEFVARYRYEAGIFLAVNAAPNLLRKLLSDQENVARTKKTIAQAERIYVLIKETRDEELVVHRLTDFH